MDFIQYIYTSPTKTKKIYKSTEKSENKLLRNKWFSTFNEIKLKLEKTYTK